MNKLILKIKAEYKTVYLLIGINLLMFGLTSLISLLVKNFQVSLYLLGAEEGTSIIWENEYFRMITSSFLHGGVLHLALNMWVLSSIGGAVERFYGGKKLFITYVFAALTGSIVSVVARFVSSYISGSIGLGLSVGASGAIFGLVGLILGNKYKKNTYSLGLENYIDMQKLWLYVGYNMLIGFGFNLLGGSVSINNWAHVGGFIGGFFLGLLLEPINTFYVSDTKKIVEKVLFILSISLVVFSFIALIINL